MVKLKRVYKIMWAYFAPDGYLQVRSLADTKKLSREMICKFEDKTYKDYETAGWLSIKTCFC